MQFSNGENASRSDLFATTLDFPPERDDMWGGSIAVTRSQAKSVTPLEGLTRTPPPFVPPTRTCEATGPPFCERPTFVMGAQSQQGGKSQGGIGGQHGYVLKRSSKVSMNAEYVTLGIEKPDQRQ